MHCSCQIVSFGLVKNLPGTPLRHPQEILTHPPSSRRGILLSGVLSLAFTPFGTRPHFPMPATGWRLLPLILVALFATAYTQAPDTAQNPASQTTREHLQHERWWPTKQFADQSQFAGSQACARCHGGIALSQSTTQMALTMMPAASSLRSSNPHRRHLPPGLLSLFGRKDRQLIQAEDQRRNRGTDGAIAVGIRLRHDRSKF